MRKFICLIGGLFVCNNAFALVGGTDITPGGNVCVDGYVYDETYGQCVVGGCVEYTDTTITCPTGTVKCCTYDSMCSVSGDKNLCKCVSASRCTLAYACGSLAYNWTQTTNTGDADCVKTYKACDIVANPNHSSLTMSAWSFRILKNTQYSCSAGCYMQDNNCFKCPGDGTSSGGSGDITSCYISAGQDFTDEHGNVYHYDTGCSYGSDS